LSGVARRYVEGFAQRGDLVARFKADPRVDTLPIEKQRSLLRIIQEGLMNVHRHAGAMRVSVVMKCVGDRLTLIIGDDGNGVLPRPVRRETEGTDLGLGIPGMRVRTQQLGGALKVRSTPRATTVVIVIPYNGA
jgi:signal transduction histidine kinase